MTTKWRVKIPDYYGKWWNELDTYTDKERALKQYEREDNAKLIRIERQLVDQKGSLPTE
jgi:hypothetical protein